MNLGNPKEKEIKRKDMRAKNPKKDKKNNKNAEQIIKIRK